MPPQDATVFVVDDDPSLRKALTRLLSSAGFQVSTFASASEFLTLAPPQARGCIVLDIKMPGMNGLELQQWLQSTGMTLPVIFVSAHADVSLTVQAMKAGAREVFTKPFDYQALIETVRAAIVHDTEEQDSLNADAALRERFALLTPRERTVMALVVTGLLNKQIAARLGTSEKTVKVHRARVMEKMQAGSLPGLVRMADRLGLPSVQPHQPSWGEVPKVQ